MRLKIVALLLMFSCFAALAQQENATEDNRKYVPELFGAVKAKFETSLYDGSHRFNVRNSRFGVRGVASDRIRYAVQIDFSNEGKISILDSYVAYFYNNIEISLGQQQYRFSTDLDRGPNSNIFANRSFLAKFLTTYYGSKLEDGQQKFYTGSIGSRDLGALIRYRLPQTPLLLSFGVFNGSGTNNPEWDQKINVVGRVQIGGKKGFQAAISHYNGHTPVMEKVFAPQDTDMFTEEFTQNIRMWGGELHYGGDNFRIEAEYAQRRLKDDGLQLLHAAHILGYYQIGIRSSNSLKYIMPVGRWDIGRNIEFLNKSKQIERFSANRATLGVNLGFAGKVIGSELRLQFEKYIPDHKPSDYSKNPLIQDKITFEVVVSF